MDSGRDSGRKVRGEATWAAARQAYLDGAAAGEVCERFGLGLSALRMRARQEGWRRSDQPDGELETAEAEAEPEYESGSPDPADLAEQAWRRAAGAVGRGRLREAQGWTRLWRELTAANDARERARTAQVSAERRAASEDACHAARGIIATLRPLEAARAALQDADQAAELHSVHSVHPVCAPADDRPLNRAERRRRERLAADEARRGALKGERKRPTTPPDGPPGRSNEARAAGRTRGTDPTTPDPGEASS